MIINKENIYGKDGFVWWIGVVEDRVNDPDKLGRVRVRIMGYHSDDLEALPTEELPWAIVMQPTTSAAVSGKGSSPTNLLEGTWCIGFFLDGKEKQQPIVIGTVGGFSQNVERCGEESTYRQVIFDGLAEIGEGIVGEDIVTDENGDPIAANFPQGNEFQGIIDTGEIIAEDFDFTSVNKSQLEATLAFQNPEYPLCSYKDKPDTNKMAIPDLEDDDTAYYKKVENLHLAPIFTALGGPTWIEPEPPFCPEYPYNQVFETEAGHVLEFDNTPGKERINLFHTNGTYMEIDVNGTMVRKVVGDNYEIIENNNRLYVRGAHNLTVEGKCRILVLNDCDVEVKNDMNVKVHGDYNLEVKGKYKMSAAEINQTTSGEFKIKAGKLSESVSAMDVYSAGAISMQSGGRTSFQGSRIDLNSGTSASPSIASAAILGTALAPASVISDMPPKIAPTCNLEPPEYEEVEPENFFEGEKIEGIDPPEYKSGGPDFFEALVAEGGTSPQIEVTPTPTDEEIIIQSTQA